MFVKENNIFAPLPPPVRKCSSFAYSLSDGERCSVNRSSITLFFEKRMENFVVQYLSEFCCLLAESLLKRVISSQKAQKSPITGKDQPLM